MLNVTCMQLVWAVVNDDPECRCCIPTTCAWIVTLAVSAASAATGGRAREE